MFSNAFKIGTVFGFPIKIDPSWILVAVLVAWSLATGYFPQDYPDLAIRVYWIMGGIGMLGLFLSVVLHELGHALVARKFGLEMGGITLFIFGGVAEMSKQPESPKVEFWVAVGGPAVTVVLALVFHGLSLLAFPAEVVAVLTYLAFVNLILLIFNLVPAFPLDGGRVLRAWLWHRKGSLRQGTRIAAGIGSAFGVVLLVLGVLQLLAGAIISAVWFAILGLFLRGIARMSYQQVVVRRVLEGQDVRRFMSTEPVTVPPEMSLSEFVEEYLYRHHHKIFPVMKDEVICGVVGSRQVRLFDRSEWNSITVGRVMQDLDDEICMSPDTDANDALERMQRSGHSRMLVVEQRDGKKHLVGIITLKDLMAFLSVKMELEEGEELAFGRDRLAADGPGR